MPSPLLARELYETLTTEAPDAKPSDLISVIRGELGKAYLEKHAEEIDISSQEVFPEGWEALVPTVETLPDLVGQRVYSNAVLSNLKRYWKTEIEHRVWLQQSNLIQRAVLPSDSADKWNNFLKEHGPGFGQRPFHQARYIQLLKSNLQIRPLLLHRCGGSWVSAHYDLDHHDWHQYHARYCYYCHSLADHGADVIETSGHAAFVCPKFEAERADLRASGILRTRIAQIVAASSASARASSHSTVVECSLAER